MLTNGDLTAIAQVIDEKLDKRLKSTEEKINKRFDSVEKNIKSIKQDVRTVQKDVRVMLAVLDRADMELRRRVERIEEHLKLTNPLS